MLTLSDIQSIPCMGDVDVLVCGGGPAGIGAALRAAAALSVLQSCSLRDLDVKLIQASVGD